jgi:aminomethyltransferase
MTDELLHSPLHEKHQAVGARLSDVAGWDMPLSYRSVIDEVAEVHSRSGIFDLTHLGRLRISGDASLDLLERVCSHDVAHQEDDTAAATLLLNDRGGIVDVCHLIRLERFWVLLTSAVNRQKVLAWLWEVSAGLAVKVDDQTIKTAMLGIAGPQAGGTLDKFLPEKVSHLQVGSARLGSFMLANYIVARVDFAGPWGLLVVLPNLFAGQAWRFITDKAGDNAIKPAGLAALDVLRLEAGMPIYGHEVNETVDPFTAGMDNCVAMNHDFIGSAALRQLAQKPTSRVRVGLVIDQPAQPTDAPAGPGAIGMMIPRQGSSVCDSAGGEIGTITSGTFSPTIDSIIAQAYLARSAVSQPNLTLFVHQEDRQLPAKIVPLPFVH